ncbi:MAG: UDP-N-acetylglucosamine 2-epimerase [Pseudotabrizicola sp.]|uniref:UDP-N-acetylglucosamine 2-epimerase n=1 Tax=Pseudotabrizicola sp. TaxID=2939647 RepID=UPI002731C39F|nr:UDP-N-acetylglucosamine 2-epimerase [Pseudotabrizicola sp.]MDP2080452.1 UDP-N-acetylglucosamine 2-epimerase [Pseudotabrizicola sp.]MDZ7573703.1 UDP-N-acetylglucosamine 2-epimerase [Pseudotabrizicola sp.]
MTKSLLFLTGTRADFGKLEPLAAAARDAGHAVTFFVTGMHMMDRYGLTKLEVQRMPGVRVHEFLNQRPGDGQDIVLAKTVVGFSDYITEHQPDLIVIHGDRIEALAGALVAATNYIPSAHIEGGEVSGTIDEVFRHCNTKLATHHFVSSDSAKRRVMVLGEAEEAIHVIGSPELDFHAGPSGVSLDEVRARYDIPFADYGIAVFHPVTSEQATMGAQAQALFGALDASGRSFVVIAPNNDPGSDAIFSVLNCLTKDRFRLIPSMRFAHFSELMKHAACMVGNSSAGVREAPFLGIPSLDVGTRQTNRAMAASVAFAGAGDASAVAQFLATRWGQRHAQDTGFGTGRAADRFAQTLTSPKFWAQGLQKSFQDQDLA